MAARLPVPRSLTMAPLYRQVKDSLVQRLADGEWLPGDFLPSEMSLAEEYSVSQGTIRKAMNSLTRDKVLNRHQGKGTSVAVPNESSVMFRYFNIVDAHGERVFPDSQVQRASIGTVTGEEARALGMEPGAQVVRIERVRLLNDEPIINESITLPCSLFPNFDLRTDHIVNALYELYAKQYKLSIVRADERVKAVPADAADASLLRVPEGAPLLMAIRVAYALQDTPIEYRVSRIRTDHYSYFSILR